MAYTVPGADIRFSKRSLGFGDQKSPGSPKGVSKGVSALGGYNVLSSYKGPFLEPHENTGRSLTGSFFDTRCPVGSMVTPYIQPQCCKANSFIAYS